MKLKVHGSRGSIAVSRPGSKYGGNTSCITVSTAVGGKKEVLVIDAGSGLMVQDGVNVFPMHILLSHLHLDHIVALGMAPSVWKKNEGVRVYTCSRDARPLAEQICAAFTPPNWPVALTAAPGLECVEIFEETPFAIGAFTVTAFAPDIHPDKALAFHITDGEKTLVHLLDSETPNMKPADAALMAKYCTGVDMVVFDAAYSEADYPKRKGFGHSTVRDGIKRAHEWNVKKMLLAHFDQKYSDEELDTWAEHWRNEKTITFVMAYDGMELTV